MKINTSRTCFLACVILSLLPFQVVRSQGQLYSENGITFRINGNPVVKIYPAIGVGLVSGPLLFPGSTDHEIYHVGPSFTARMIIAPYSGKAVRTIKLGILTGFELTARARTTRRVLTWDGWVDSDENKLRQNVFYLAPCIRYLSSKSPLRYTLAIGGHIQGLWLSWWGGDYDSGAPEYYFENVTGGSIIAQIEYRRLWIGLSIHLNKMSRVGKHTNRYGNTWYGTQWYDSNPTFLSVGMAW